MKSPLSFDQVLFDVAQVPVEAVIGSNGSTRRIQVPGKKALVNERTGLVLGVVGRDYKVVANQEAIDLLLQGRPRARNKPDCMVGGNALEFTSSVLSDFQKLGKASLW